MINKEPPPKKKKTYCLQLQNKQNALLHQPNRPPQFLIELAPPHDDPWNFFRLPRELIMQVSEKIPDSRKLEPVLA